MITSYIDHEKSESDMVRQLFDSLSKIKVIFPRAIIKEVYDGDVDSGLNPGQVLVNTAGEWVSKSKGSRDVVAWVVVPYGLKPQTEEDQKSHNRIENPFNQNFGFYGMPRVGDTVFLIGINRKVDGLFGDEYFVFGSVFSLDVCKPPLVDREDLQVVHRSGASLRLNDTFGGGGSLVSPDEDGEGLMRGLTGNLTMVGNRVMVLSGTKYLSHGLLSKYGDIRNRFKDAKIDVFKSNGEEDEKRVGETYKESFSNDEEEEFFDPFIDSSLEDKKFLSPPSFEDPIIPINNNTLLFSQHGGGVFRIDDHSEADGYSRITMGATSMSFMVGKDYKKLGLAGDSSDTKESGKGITPDADVYEVQHKTGSRIKIDNDGNIEIIIAQGKDIIINDPEGEGALFLGEGTDQAIRNGDETTKRAAIQTMPHFGNLGFPHEHNHEGHKHTVVKSQDKTYV